MIADAMRLGDVEYSAPALREMVPFLAGSNTPTEIEEIFQRFMPVQPSQDHIRTIADRVGSVMETGEQVICRIVDSQGFAAGKNLVP